MEEERKIEDSDRDDHNRIDKSGDDEDVDKVESGANDPSLPPANDPSLPPVNELDAHPPPTDVATESSPQPQQEEEEEDDVYRVCDTSGTLYDQHLARREPRDHRFWRLNRLMFLCPPKRVARTVPIANLPIPTSDLPVVESYGTGRVEHRPSQPHSTAGNSFAGIAMLIIAAVFLFVMIVRWCLKKIREGRVVEPVNDDGELRHQAAEGLGSPQRRKALNQNYGSAEPLLQEDDKKWWHWWRWRCNIL